MKSLQKSMPYVVGTIIGLFAYEVLDELDVVDRAKRSVTRLLR